MATLASTSRQTIAQTICRRTFATEAPSRPRLSASVVLNRAPLLTPTPSAFESAYYNYQYKLHRALSTPFPQHFYFKKGTNLQQRFYNEEKDRDKWAFGTGFGKGVRLRLPPLPYDKPLPREHDADRTGDVKSLDRKGERNLYLLLQTKDKGRRWRLPQGIAAPGEALHVAAGKQLASECGDEMDTWMVGRQPIGFYEDSEKVFFFKVHIFSGQVNLNSSNVQDFAWLTKEEIADRVEEAYWSGIKDMLSNH
ncbi:54S ribosomal protein L17 mitochondrial [Tulasnella sp. 403]|nr:54S ribosomal protein L17 mitochondrial [Tulasnella sp. 403]